MKRQTAMALAAVFAMSVAGTALAAPANPFVDVPAKHWSYDSINQLVKAGVISGYGDGTYKGDRTLTRYEMATIVAKAMANEDKADAETRKTIEALKAEYGTELNNLGVRVSNLEKNASKVKFTGEVRERYDWQDKTGFDSTATRNYEKTRIRLNMEAPIDQNVTFHGRFESESAFGNSDSNNPNTTKLTQAYIAGKAGDVNYSFGRQPIFLGQGLLADLSGNCDGLMLGGGNDVKVTAGVFKYKSAPYFSSTGVSENFYAANIDAKLSKNLDFSVSYLKDKDGLYYKSSSAGLSYTGLKNFTISGEFGQNDSDLAKSVNNNDKAKAWMGKLKYQGAQGNKVGSLGIWAGYRNADPGFDVLENTTLDAGNLDGSFGYLDNVKGPEFGVEYTVFRNGILTIQYNAFELKDYTPGVEKDKKNMFAYLVYSF